MDFYLLFILEICFPHVNRWAVYRNFNSNNLFLKINVQQVFQYNIIIVCFILLSNPLSTRVVIAPPIFSQLKLQYAIALLLLVSDTMLS